MRPASMTLEPSTARPFDELPAVGILALVKNLAKRSGGARGDMRSALERFSGGRPIVRQRLGFRRSAFLLGPDANRLVLMDKDKIFSARKPWMQIMGRIFPNGLLLRDGDDHVMHRRIMHGAFTRPVLREYVRRMGPMIETGTRDWSSVDDFHAFPAIKKLTLGMAVSIFLGEELDSEAAEMNAAFEAMVAASMSQIRLRIPGLEFYRGLRGREYMLAYLQARMAKKREGAGADLFSQLTRATGGDGERFTDQEILDHLVFLMMAAHDTTTSTLTSMLYELARHPEWQERLREESAKIGPRALEFDELDRLESATLVMKETLRRYPPLPVIPRVAGADFEFAGYRIPAGTGVIVSPIMTHHMEEWWSEPFRFDPERFSPERAEDQRHTHSWIPFGAGPHHCIGLRFAEAQIKSVIHRLVQQYRFTVPDGYTMPVQQAPISKPVDGLPLELVRIGEE